MNDPNTPRRTALVATVAALLGISSVHTSTRPNPAPGVVEVLASQSPDLQSHVLRLAFDATACASRRGLISKPQLLTVIDYSRPSTEPRLWVFDVASRRLVFHERVAHGRNSGDNLTTRFSNEPGSLQTSLGLFVTAGTYVGRNGYSLRLRGLEQGVNDRAEARAIVIHGAPYVSTETTRTLGRLGRSWGCPAVSLDVARGLIDTIKGGSAVFAYYPDSDWLDRSDFLLPSCGLG